MNLAIVGATGMVGRVFIRLLEERNFPYTKLFLVASKKSAGKELLVREEKHLIITIEELVKKDVDLAFFSAGREISKNWAPVLAKKGCKVIDNSSYWRMCSKHKLIIPEINANQLTNEDLIIANPNCSTIQLLMVLAPIHKKYTINRVVVSTYQSVTGTGMKALHQLEKETKGIAKKKHYPYQIYDNVLPHCDDFLDNSYTKEEMKLTNETKKILDPKILVTATAVRVPVTGGHSESVNITCNKTFKISEILETLKKQEGVSVIDNICENKYPMPFFAKNNNDVFVGRIRRDFTLEKSLNLWVVSDNLRKGAATNSIQIAEYLLEKKLIKKHDS
tara:strand:+ start:1099 stop:2100 length:1002 start_codon:yes stop_codon:yes gene_type:complete